ncbi:MAG: AAA family ATPase [Bacteroidales bacterium]|nr:AAA family ATPase [Bacteroidales bacterium]
MDSIEIKGYKSIKEAKVELRPVNILIGANGAGKSNFISFFDFLNNIYNQKLKEYVALRGENKILHNGKKITQTIYSNISFDNDSDAYSFSIQLGEEGFIFSEEDLWYQNNHWDISNFNPEAQVKKEGFNNKANYIRNHLENLKKYHFHDTSKNSPFTETCDIENDSYFLYETGKNISAFLFRIQMENQIVYNRIVKTIQSIAPFFSNFFFEPNSEGLMRLQWQDKYSSTVYGANDLSDGTLRFIALTVLFMQPNLPDSIIIDEPELGLHPLAIAKFAGMVKSVAKKGTQVIVATQSTDFISYFEPEDIITVNQIDGESKFKRLKKEDLSVWLEDYTLGELWQRNIITDGQPKQ